MRVKETEPAHRVFPHEVVGFRPEQDTKKRIPRCVLFCFLHKRCFIILYSKCNGIVEVTLQDYSFLIPYGPICHAIGQWRH